MAGLLDYLTMGFVGAGLYIGVKYGPQIINNLKQNQANPQAQAQTPAQQTSTPTAPASQTPASQGDNLDLTSPVYNIPKHPNDTGTYPKSTQRKAAAPPLSLHDQGINIQPNNAGAIHPSNGPHVAPTPSTKPHKRRHTTLPEHHQGPCPDGSYPDKDNSCKPTYLQTNIGYFDYYSVPVPGPEWRKTIPNYQFVASQGMSNLKQGRVRRSLAANNSNFMPGGFVLSEASVRRGVNNVYSAGT